MPDESTSRNSRVLIIDINNYSMFPTLAIGLLVASLRNSDFKVELLSPLAKGVVLPAREHCENLFDKLVARIQYSTWHPFRKLQDILRRIRLHQKSRPNSRVIQVAKEALDSKPDILLLSAHLEHYPTVRIIGELARERAIPLIVGGGAFTMQRTTDTWRNIPGLHAIVGAEVDASLPDIVSTVLAGKSLLGLEGITLPDGTRSTRAAPLRALSRVPVPDFTDFPWDRYSFRVIPVMTGRGCQWNKCTFCNDIVTVSGRTFRSRSVDSVLDEVKNQAQRHLTANFIFLDLKLNSNPAMFRGIADRIQTSAPGAQWIGTVHVDQRKDNGLSYTDLQSAVASGMRRVSFGLETGSQRLLDLMEKGCTVEGNTEFIRNAHQAGLSIRCTMFKGYPGETAADLQLTANLLERHGKYIDRIRFGEFALAEDTSIFHAVKDHPTRYPQIKIFRFDYRNALLRHINTDSEGKEYRVAKRRVLNAIFDINRRPIRASAREFDGLM